MFDYVGYNYFRLVYDTCICTCNLVLMYRLRFYYLIFGSFIHTTSLPPVLFVMVYHRLTKYLLYVMCCGAKYKVVYNIITMLHLLSF